MNILPNAPLPDHLLVLGGRCLLRFEDIILIEGQGNYTLFRRSDATEVLTSKSLSWYQGRLPDYLIRAHKSYFVNLAFVVAFEKKTIRLSDGKCIEVSRRRRRAVRKLVKTQLNPLSYL